jgi:hypothetical protein
VTHKIIVLCASFGLGFLTAWELNRNAPVYSVHILADSAVKAIRLNTRTGEIWTMTRNGIWKKSDFSISSGGDGPLKKFDEQPLN